MRINKFIARSGYTSRRKADELIKNGNVKVNGAVLMEPGYDVEKGDKIVVNGHEIEFFEEKVYILLNKPIGFVTTVSDQFDRPTVIDLLTDVPERVFPVGRLDYNTSGLLLLTNDGDFAYRVSHPKHQVPKTYRAAVQGRLSKEALRTLRKGVDIGGFMTSPAQVTVTGGGKGHTIVDITIHEGKNRQVRKMFKAVGFPVMELERKAIGTIELGKLSEGHYRKLTRQEIEYLTADGIAEKKKDSKGNDRRKGRGSTAKRR